jgi:hypothetical protein
MLFRRIWTLPKFESGGPERKQACGRGGWRPKFHKPVSRPPCPAPRLLDVSGDGCRIAASIYGRSGTHQ